ncbi:MAG: D-glycero-beta-D-manno-heptose-7-phosphate kinase [archaeon]
MERLRGIINNFSDVSVLVIGDIMVDKYIWGDVHRISPEAPVQIVNVRKESHSPGGAANTAANIGALDGKTFLVGVMGNDAARTTLNVILSERGVETKGVIIDPAKPTTQKVRVVAQGQQLLRIDYEKSEFISGKDEKRVLDYVKRTLPKVNIVVISDYAKGLVTESLIRGVEKLAVQEKKMVIIDPKPTHHVRYQNASLITPNLKEAFGMAGIPYSDKDDVVKVGKMLLERTQSNLLITRGAQGMSLLLKDGTVSHIPTMAREVFDVTGAGDTTIAALALALGAGATFEDAATIANYAAGITVGKIGTSTVSRPELLRGVERP